MSFRDDTLQAIGDWIVASTGLVSTELIKGNQERSVALSRPFLEMHLVTFDIPIGQDEVIDADEGAGQIYVTRGWRRGSMTLNGYGAGADEWLVELAASAKLPGTVDRFLSAGLAISDYGSITEAGIERDGITERVFSRTMQIAYGIEVRPGVEVVKATSYRVDLEFALYDGDPDPWTKTITGSIP